MATTAEGPSPLLDKLPIIDIAPLLNPTSSSEAISDRKQTAEALHDACRNYGFFYLNIAAYLDPKESEELARLGREFFGLPQAEKDKISLSNQDHARGECAPDRCPLSNRSRRVSEIEREHDEWKGR
jgi:isopenicillin N synthase-like dioxygenase